MLKETRAAMDQFICVVDDDIDIREVLQEALAFEGYSVVAASDGAEALERLHGHEGSCCLILLDLMMPCMNGWEFRRKQVEDPGLEPIPVVLLTGAGGAARTAEDLKVAGALEKPVELQTVLDVAARFCGVPAERAPSDGGRS
jgi:two-component system, chemotaxis family, chemotaxis protein CheY